MMSDEYRYGNDEYDYEDDLGAPYETYRPTARRKRTNKAKATPVKAEKENNRKFLYLVAGISVLGVCFLSGISYVAVQALSSAEPAQDTVAEPAQDTVAEPAQDTVAAGKSDQADIEKAVAGWNQLVEKINQLPFNSMKTGILTIGANEVTQTGSLTNPIQGQLDFTFTQQEIGKYYRTHEYTLVFGWKDGKWIPIKLQFKGGVNKLYSADFSLLSEDTLSPQIINVDGIADSTPFKEIFNLCR